MTPRAERSDATTGGFVHTGLVFGSLPQLVSTAVPLIRTAVAEGDRVLAVLGSREWAAVRSGLSPPLARRVEPVSRESFYDAPGRTLAALHRLAGAQSGQRTTVVAQPALPHGDALALREWHRLDSVLNTALAADRIRLLCVHDARNLPASVQEEVWRTHPAAADGARFRPNPRYRDPEELSARDAAHPLPPPAEPVRRTRVTADLPAVRQEVTRVAEELDMPAARIRDLVVAVNELAANVLEHGAGKGTVALWRSGARIVCDVVDEAGQLTDPLSGYHPNDVLNVRGYGLWITRQMCDFMEVRGDLRGSVVRMHFRV